MQKRINREIVSLRPISINEIVNYDTDIICIYYKNCSLRANIELYIKNYLFKFPQIYVNKHKYTDLLNYNLLSESCLCCDSITCNDKWNLSLKLIDINNEIEKYLKLKSRSADLICMSKIDLDPLPKEIQDLILTYI